MKSKILNGLILSLFFAGVCLDYFSQNAINEKIYLTLNNSSSQQQLEKSEKPNEVSSSINVVKILLIFFGCLSTAAMSLISENLLNRIVVRIKDIIVEVTDDQGLLKNISSEDILKIANQMKLIRCETNAIRISLFKLDKNNAILFLESSLNGRYSLANSPPVARQFFDLAVLPMIESDQNYSYCGNNGNVCQTWLAQRGSGRYAIRLFFYKTFTGFILIEWKLSLMEKVFKKDNMLNSYREQLDLLASIIINAIKEKK